MNKSRPEVNENDHIRGGKNAPVTLVEYADFECPFCSQAYVVLKKLEQDVGNKFILVFRHFPLIEIHPRAMPAAKAAESAGRQEKFWEMHDLLFENQDRLEDEDFREFANKLGLDVEKFVADLQSVDIEQKIKEDIESGGKNGVSGTPTFFVNDLVLEGLYPYDELRAMIETAAK